MKRHKMLRLLVAEELVTDQAMPIDEQGPTQK